jgi:hypothetical protein
MTTASHILRSTCAAAATLAALATLAACMREDTSDCPPEAAREVLVVRAVDQSTGADITASGSVRDAVLMVFGEDDRFVARIDLTGEQLGRQIALPAELLARTAGERLRVSAWGNIESNIAFQEGIGTGHKITDQFLGLRENHEHPDNWYNPGDVYFGLDTLTLGGDDRATRATDDTARVVHAITVTQKTARMAVSVRGLPAGARASDYYFSMCEQNDGFTFDGTPLRNNRWCKIREDGVFNEWGDFVTDEPYYVIHSVDPTDASGCAAGVCLYKVGGGPGARAEGPVPASCHGTPTGGATRALTSDMAGYVTADGDMNMTGKAKMDVAGNHLALVQGRTTNVLINFTSPGVIELHVEMTDWNETYQWRTW